MSHDDAAAVKTESAGAPIAARLDGTAKAQQSSGLSHDAIKLLSSASKSSSPKNTTPGATETPRRGRGRPVGSGRKRAAATAECECQTLPTGDDLQEQRQKKARYAEQTAALAAAKAEAAAANEEIAAAKGEVAVAKVQIAAANAATAERAAAAKASEHYAELLESDLRAVQADTNAVVAQLDAERTAHTQTTEERDGLRKQLDRVASHLIVPREIFSDCNIGGTTCHEWLTLASRNARVDLNTDAWFYVFDGCAYGPYCANYLADEDFGERPREEWESSVLHLGRHVGEGHFVLPTFLERTVISVKRRLR